MLAGSFDLGCCVFSVSMWATPIMQAYASIATDMKLNEVHLAVSATCVLWICTKTILVSMQPLTPPKNQDPDLKNL